MEVELGGVSLLGLMGNNPRGGGGGGEITLQLIPRTVPDIAR